MARPLSMLVSRYDRNRALLDGEVRIEGVDLSIREVDDDSGRQRLGLSGAFDVWEAYAGRYLIDLGAGHKDFVALPIFAKRTFRHSSVYVRRDRSVRSARDLNGRRVGIQHWATTAAIWAKGILAEEHGVELASIRWLQTSPDDPPTRRPPWLQIAQAMPGADLAALLAAGDLDAAITSNAWVPYEHPSLAFLFPDYAALERDYFARTRIFPIMHLLLVRASILDDDPSIALRLYEAWSAAKDLCYERLERERLTMTSMWFQALLEEERAAAGSRDTYPFGLAASRHEVAKLIDYAYEQRVIWQRPRPEDIFHPATLGT